MAGAKDEELRQRRLVFYKNDVERIDGLLSDFLTVAKAKKLYSGQTICEKDAYNADKTPRRWRVSGAVKTWKRSPGRVQVPLKHGMYAFGYLTEDNVSRFFIGGNCGW